MIKDIKFVITVFGLFISILAIWGWNNLMNNYREVKLLESRIARQEKIIEHHIKEAAFDSTNQANQKRVK